MKEPQQPVTLSSRVVTILQKELGLSLREIAQVTDIHPSEVTRIKAGEREWRMVQLETIAQYCHVSLSGLMALAEKNGEPRSDLSAKFGALGDIIAEEVLKAIHELRDAPDKDQQRIDFVSSRIRAEKNWRGHV